MKKNLSPNVVDDDSNLLYKGLPVSTIMDYKEVTFVSVNGNDTTALRGRIDRPFRTIAAAVRAPYIDTYKIHSVIVLSGEYQETVKINRNMTLCLQGANLKGFNNGPAIVYEYGGGGTIYLEHSYVGANSTDPAIALAEGVKVYGRGKSLVYNEGTGIAIYGSANWLENLIIANNGAADKPAVHLIDGQTRNVYVSSTNGPALWQRRINIAHSLFEDSSFYSENRLGVYCEGGGFFRRCQMRSKTSHGLGGGYFSTLQMDNCKVFSDTNHAVLLVGEGNPDFRNTIFVGALDCIYSYELTLGHHEPSKNNYVRFDNCEFYAGPTGKIFNINFSIYDWAGKRIMTTNSRMNKALVYNATGYTNPKGRFSEMSNMVLQDMACPHEWIDYRR